MGKTELINLVSKNPPETVKTKLSNSISLKVLLIFALFLTGCDEKITFKHQFNKDEIVYANSEIGRFKIILGQYRRDCFLLDTKTGRVWNLAVDSSREGDPVFWSEMLIENNQECGVLYEVFDIMHKKKKESNKVKNN